MRLIGLDASRSVQAILKVTRLNDIIELELVTPDQLPDPWNENNIISTALSMREIVIQPKSRPLPSRHIHLQRNVIGPKAELWRI